MYAPEGDYPLVNFIPDKTTMIFDSEQKSGSVVPIDFAVKFPLLLFDSVKYGFYDHADIDRRHIHSDRILQPPLMQ